MLAFADFGIANGVLSVVADAHGRDDRAGIRRAVSSGFFLLTGIAAAVAVLFALLYGFVSWSAVFNVSGARASAEAGPALAVFVFCFACNIPLAVVQRTQMGLQQGFMASLWQCVGSISGLVGVLLAIHVEGGLPWLVLALAGAPLLAALLNSLYFFPPSPARSAAPLVAGGARHLSPGGEHWRIVLRAAVGGGGRIHLGQHHPCKVARSRSSCRIRSHRKVFWPHYSGPDDRTCSAMAGVWRSTFKRRQSVGAVNVEAVHWLVVRLRGVHFRHCVFDCAEFASRMGGEDRDTLNVAHRGFRSLAHCRGRWYGNRHVS